MPSPEVMFLLARFSKVVGFYGIPLHKFSTDLSQYFTPIFGRSVGMYVCSPTLNENVVAYWEEIGQIEESPHRE